MARPHPHLTPLPLQPPIALVRRLNRHRHQPRHIPSLTWPRALALAAVALVLGAGLGSLATAPAEPRTHQAAR